MNKLELQKTANEVRKGIVTAVHGAKAGHPGGSLSAADIFTYLYFEEMNIDPKDPKKAGTLLGSGKQRLFPGRGPAYAASSRFLSAGTSLHAGDAWRRYVFRLSWTGYFCGSWYGSGC